VSAHHLKRSAGLLADVDDAVIDKALADADGDVLTATNLLFERLFGPPPGGR
jgi:hypothetical protein